MARRSKTRNDADNPTVVNQRLRGALACWRRFVKDKGGAILIIFAFTLPILIGGVGLGIEMGLWYLEKRKVQEAADSGALSGALEYRSNSSLSQGDLEAAVTTTIGQNGYGSLTPAVSRPPLTGPFATGGAMASTSAVEVVLTYPHPTYFVRIFGLSSIDIQARAVASEGGGVSDICILALGNFCSASDKKSPFTANGNGDMTLDDCNIHANGICPTSVDIGNNALVEADCISGNNQMSDKTLNNYVAGVTPPSGLTKGVVTECAGGPHHLGDNLTDPYGTLVAPKPSGFCNTASDLGGTRVVADNSDFLKIFSPIGTAHAGHKASHGGSSSSSIGKKPAGTDGGGLAGRAGAGAGPRLQPDLEDLDLKVRGGAGRGPLPGVDLHLPNLEDLDLKVGGGDPGRPQGRDGGTTYQLISPGFYCPTGDSYSEDNYLLKPGVYYFSGDVKIHGIMKNENSGGDDDAGVVIILTGSGASLDINGSGATDLRAPTKSTISDSVFSDLTTPSQADWAGMLIYNDTTGTASGSKLNGNSDTSFTGYVYMPNDKVTFNGGSAVSSGNGCFGLIADEIDVIGNTAISTKGCGADYDSFTSGSAIGLVE